MSVLTKRIYISKLPDCLSKSDIESKFSHYGKVASVEIIHRKNGVREDQPPFAYVNLETSDEELFRCIRDFANKKWKGEFLDVQLAKESFLTRLQREREAEQNKKQSDDGKVKAQVFNQSGGEEFNLNQEIQVGKSRGKKSYFDEENKSFNEEVKKEFKRKKIYFGEEDGDVKEEIINHSLPLNGSGSVENSTSTVKKDPKHIEADQKRKSSNIEKRNQYRQQKLQIRSALSNLDGKATNKKIIFDENIVDKQISNNKRNKQLFDEDGESEEDMNVPSKPQFEGKEGHKLFQLQSRFHNDKRFVMNEKFREDDNLEENENDNPDPKDEKEKQLSILQEVLGKKVAAKPKDVKQPKVMLRFDPDDPQHKAYELQHQEEEKPPTKKKKRKEAPETDEAKPEVSKTKFYKVSDDLKNVFQAENKSFSLLASRGDEIADENELQEANLEEVTEMQKKTAKDTNGAFNNVTSDEEVEEEKIMSQEQKEADSAKTKSASERVRFWSEPFFFKEDDFRFQEGVDFIKRLGSQEDGDFLELRRNVKEVVRAKVKNVNKKNGMFKKKLGGVKKRMKMKRALKR